MYIHELVLGQKPLFKVIENILDFLGFFRRCCLQSKKIHFFITVSQEGILCHLLTPVTASAEDGCSVV